MICRSVFSSFEGDPINSVYWQDLVSGSSGGYKSISPVRKCERVRILIQLMSALFTQHKG